MAILWQDLQARIPAHTIAFSTHNLLACSNISFYFLLLLYCYCTTLYLLLSTTLYDRRNNTVQFVVYPWHTLIYSNNKMSLQGPKQWSSILQFNNKTWSDIDRRNIIMDKLEHWSGFNCFYRPGISPKFKICRCLESLHDSDR